MPESTPDPLALMRRIGRLYRLMHAAIQPSLEGALDLQPKQVQVLSAIAAGQTSPSQVSAQVGLPAPSTSRLIDQLVGAGLIERQSDARDLRRFQLTLTPDGRRTLAEARAVARAALTQLLNAAPPDEVRAADQGLAGLEARLGLKEA